MNTYNIKQKALLCLFLSLFFTESAISQNKIPSGKDNDAEMKKLIENRNYYSHQSRKFNLSDNKREEFSSKLKETEEKIFKLDNKKREELAKSPNAVKELSSLDSAITSRESEFSMKASALPQLYAYEPNSNYLGFQVGFASKRYSSPVLISYERGVTDAISVGAVVGRFIEQVDPRYSFTQPKPYYRVATDNFKFRYLTFAGRVAYHFNNSAKPLLPADRFDLYVAALAGINISTNAKKYDIDVNEPTSPIKDGINFAIMPGIKVMVDQRLGICLEAGYGKTSFVNIGASYNLTGHKANLGDKDPRKASRKYRMRIKEEEKRKAKKK